METGLPTGFTSRPIVLDDSEAVTDLLNEYAKVAFGFPKLAEGEIRGSLTAPGFDAAGSTRAVLAPNGQMVGAIVVFDTASPPVHPQIAGAVDQAFEGRGIGTHLLQWGIERARQAVARVPAGVRVAVRVALSGTHEPTRQLHQDAGFRLVRYSWLMSMDLDRLPPEPAWPEGIVVRTYQERPDLRAIVRAVNDAFRDHWGYVDRPEAEMLERSEHRIKTDEEFDPTLWFLAMDGEEIAGMSLCQRSFVGDPDMGFVDQLGVRRPWRRRGLAEALLHHSFREFYRRGQKRAGLGVDAGSLTGATHLYEKVGMHVAQQVDTYELELRPGEELSRQSL